MSELGTRIDMLLDTLAPRERAVLKEKLFTVPTPTWAQIARNHTTSEGHIRLLRRHAIAKLSHPVRQREMASWVDLWDDADDGERSNAAALRAFAANTGRAE